MPALFASITLSKNAAAGVKPPMVHVTVRRCSSSVENSRIPLLAM